MNDKQRRAYKLGYDSYPRHRENPFPETNDLTSEYWFFEEGLDQAWLNRREIEGLMKDVDMFSKL